MPRSKRPKHPVIDITYRLEPPGSVSSNWSDAQRFLGKKVVVYLPDYPPEKQWKRGYLVGLLPAQDLFVIKWRRKGFGRQLKGIWRVHQSSLFEGTNLLPVPKYPAKLPQSTNNPQGGSSSMATPKKRPAKKAGGTATKKRPAKKKAPAAEAEDNGAKKTGGRTRGPDKLEGLTERQRTRIAALIFKERSKSPATSWPDIQEMVEEKYDWSLPGSMTGRRLLREYGPDEAEEAIIKQDRSATKKKAKAKPKAAKKGAVVEDDEELEDEELEDEEEELEDDEDIEAEADDEDEEYEDEEEDEEEEEAPPPKPRSKKKVTVKKAGRKRNPS